MIEKVVVNKKERYIEINTTHYTKTIQDRKDRYNSKEIYIIG
jgi:hypothetical protein